jgi:hypothetical protein
MHSQEMQEEMFWEALDEKIHDMSTEREKQVLTFLTNDVEYREVFFRYAKVARDMAYTEGYNDGQSDAQEAYYYEQHKRSMYD